MSLILAQNNTTTPSENDTIQAQVGPTQTEASSPTRWLISVDAHEAKPRTSGGRGGGSGRRVRPGEPVLVSVLVSVVLLKDAGH